MGATLTPKLERAARALCAADRWNPDMLVSVGAPAVIGGRQCVALFDIRPAWTLYLETVVAANEELNRPDIAP